jgi:DNA segregation ATPase FtsK/SpoIIIE-like protein
MVKIDGETQSQIDHLKDKQRQLEEELNGWLARDLANEEQVEFLAQQLYELGLEILSFGHGKPLYNDGTLNDAPLTAENYMDLMGEWGRILSPATIKNLQEEVPVNEYVGKVLLYNGDEYIGKEFWHMINIEGNAFRIRIIDEFNGSTTATDYYMGNAYEDMDFNDYVDEDKANLQTQSAPSRDSYLDENGRDILYEDVVAFVVEQQKISASMIQRRFSTGYNRARALIEQLEEGGVIGPEVGTKPRQVLIAAKNNR